MWNSSKRYLEEALQLQYFLRDKYQHRLEELGTYRPYRLIRRGGEQRAYYSAVHRESHRKKYLGAATNPAVQRMMECRYYEELIPRIEENIYALEKLLAGFRDLSPKSVLEGLPGYYQAADSGLILPDEGRVKNWLRDKQAKKSRITPIRQDELTIRAFDGTMMRSRIEEITYEAFHLYGIPVVYECPLEYRTETGLEYLFPDFLLLDPFTYEELIWEHLGLWYDEKKHRAYRASTRIRFNKYQELGFRHSQNLFTFVEGPNGEVDLTRLHRQVRSLAMPPGSGLNRPAKIG